MERGLTALPGVKPDAIAWGPNGPRSHRADRPEDTTGPSLQPKILRVWDRQGVRESVRA
jgi:hypothetical protein